MRPIEHLYVGHRRDPDAIAVAGPGGPLTYAELVSAVEALAAALQSLDAEHGSRVGICARNTVEHLLALLATYAAGKVWVPLNPTNGRADLDRMIGATRPSLIIADESSLDRFSPTDAPVVLAKTEAGVGSDRHVPTVRGLIDEWVVSTGDQGFLMEDPLDIQRGYGGPASAPGAAKGKKKAGEE